MRRRGRTGAHCVPAILLSIGTGSRARCWRSGWGRCWELDGEQAYEKMRRAVEKASQAEKEIQVERASQPVRTSQFPSRKGPAAGHHARIRYRCGLGP